MVRNGPLRWVNNTSYSPLVTTLGVDAVIGPRSITASTILQHVRPGRIRSVHSLGEHLGEVIEAEIRETSALAGVAIRNMDLPDGGDLRSDCQRRRGRGAAQHNSR